MKTKLCSKCNSWKNTKNFWKLGNGRLYCFCKTCESKRMKLYYLNNRSHLIDCCKSYYKDIVCPNNTRSTQTKCQQTLGYHKWKGYKIDITVPELIVIANKTDFCPICNRKLNKELGNKGKGSMVDSMAFDCINNKKEFIRGNIQAICCSCNVKKRKGTKIQK